MAYYGTYSGALGFYVFGPLSVFLFEPTVLTDLSRDAITRIGPSGPVEWFYLSTTPDLAGVFATASGFGVLSPVPSDNYIGPYNIFSFGVNRDVFVSGPYLVVYSYYSRYLAVLQLPVSVLAMRGTTLYLVFYFESVPLN